MCGFAVTDVLPPTYLHVLAFPLSVALMTERAFPFPLVGMVHVGNSITVARPVRADETGVAARCGPPTCARTPAGRQFDLLAEATVDGEVVWSGRSTYLRRGKPPEGAREREVGPVDEARAGAAGAAGRAGARAGRHRPPLRRGVRRPQPDPPAHADGQAFGFPSAIAHGMWLKARTLATLEGRLPDAYTVDVAFKLPVLLPSTIAIGARPADGGWTLDVRGAKSGKPHLTGTVSASQP